MQKRRFISDHLFRFKWSKKKKTKRVSLCHVIKMCHCIMTNLFGVSHQKRKKHVQKNSNLWYDRGQQPWHITHKEKKGKRQFTLFSLITDGARASSFHTWWISSRARCRMETSGSLRQSTMVDRWRCTEAASICTTLPRVFRATYRMLLSRFRRNLRFDRIMMEVGRGGGGYSRIACLHR